MAEIINGLCMCETCVEDREALQRQLEHPFYKEAEAFREGVKMETMEKAAKKYDEPFNPANWTSEQLAKHAMAENYDQMNYIYGLYTALRASEEKTIMYKERIKTALEVLEDNHSINDTRSVLEHVKYALKGISRTEAEN